jgi:hypothetical protein
MSPSPCYVVMFTRCNGGTILALDLLRFFGLSHKNTSLASSKCHGRNPMDTGGVNMDIKYR